jgi:hypothetical protein
LLSLRVNAVALTCGPASVASGGEASRGLLSYVGDQTMAEIAAEKGTSVPAVSQRFSTIHKAIEHALAA